MTRRDPRVQATEGPADWLVEELDRREKSDHGGEAWDAVEARIREQLVRRRSRPTRHPKSSSPA
jgi:hypothetical protein